MASGGPRDLINLNDLRLCVVLAGINGINALLECVQQNNANAMVDSDFPKLPGIC